PAALSSYSLLRVTVDYGTTRFLFPLRKAPSLLASSTVDCAMNKATDYWGEYLRSSVDFCSLNSFLLVGLNQTMILMLIS
ncbi:hypothetical protein SOVF_012180 isoform C, partial [Spinacia oleracea]